MFLFFKISLLTRGTFMFSQFSGTVNWSFYPLKKVLFLGSSVQSFLIPTANLLIIPGTLFYLDCLFPMMVLTISS